VITGDQIRAARALLNWSARELAENCGLGVATIRRMELVAGVPSSNAQNLDRVQRTFEEFGIEFIGDPDDCPGVRNLRIRRGLKN